MDADEVVVRRATRSDVDLVMSATDLVDHGPTEEWTQDFLDRGSNLLVIAVHEDVPVGLLAAVETGFLDASPDLFVYSICVRDDMRGHGLAHKLVAKATEIAEEAGCGRVWGTVDHGAPVAADTPLSPPEAETSEATTFSIPLE